MRRYPAVVQLATVADSLIFLKGQCADLRAHGAEVTVVASPGPELSAFGDAEQIAVHGVSMARALTPGRDLVALVRLARLFLRLQPDIVHAHTPKAGLLGMMAAWLTRVPVRVYHVHGLPFETRQGWRREVLRWSERISCRLATGVLCVSPSCLDVLQREGLCPAGKGQVLGSGSIRGVDPEFFDLVRVRDAATHLRKSLGIPPAAPVVGFVGRVVRDKGIEELAAAWERIGRLLPDAHLLLVGKVEDENPVAPDVLTALQDDPRVHFLGFTSDPAIPMGLMTVLALPSHREGFGLVAIEAGAMGIPVVGTKVTGLADAIRDGETGTLVALGDIAGLARALWQYLSDPALRNRHGEASRNRVLMEFVPSSIYSLSRAYYAQQLKVWT